MARRRRARESQPPTQLEPPQAPPPATRVPFAAQAIGIFATALLIRAIHILQMRASPFFSVLMGDSRGYDQWARQIAAGDWIGREVFYQAPLYPYFLGTLYAVAGPDLMVVRIVQALIGSLACVLLGLAGARLFGARVGLLAGLGLAIYAPAIFLDTLIQKSILDVFFICLALWLMAAIIARRDDETPRLRWVALGVALGALSLTRENALVLVAIVLLWALTTKGPAPFRKGPAPFRNGAGPFRGQMLAPAALTAAALIVAGLAIVLAPVAIRNKAVGGGFYLTTSQFGSNFFIGNNPRADGSYISLREGRGSPEYERVDATALAEQALGRTLTPAEVSAYWRDRALRYIASEPIDWLQLMGRKLLLLVNATEMLDTESQESHAEWSLPLRIGAVVGHFGILLPLALFGAVVSWPDRGRLWVIYALASGYATSVVIFFVFARYRYPLVPFVMLFAAAGVARLPHSLRVSTPRQRLAAALVLAAVLVAAHWPVLSADVMRAITETNLGTALQEQKRLDEAVAHYRRAAQIRPDYAPAHNNLGVALRAQGRLHEAIASYRRAVALRSDYPDAHYNLANALIEAGLAEQAVFHYETALQTLAGRASAHNNFGIALVNSGRLDQAITEFRTALKLEPDSPLALRNLGDALARRGEHTEAITHLRRLVTLRPDDPGAHYDLGGVLLEAGRLREAADAFRDTIRLAPAEPRAYNNLGIILASQGKLDEAMANWRKALELNPAFEDAERNLAKAKALGR